MTKENAAPLSEKEIQEYAAALDATTPGEWWDDKGLLWIPYGGLHQAGMGIPKGTDSAFCARAHNIGPRLIATIRDLQAANEQKERRISELEKRLHEMATDERFRRLREELTLSSHQLPPTGKPIEGESGGG